MNEQDQRYQVLRHNCFAGPLLLVALGWALYFVEDYLGWRIGGPRGRDWPIPLAVPMIGSVVLPVGFYIYWRCVKGIFERGVAVTAIVESFGIAYRGSRVTVFCYEFEGVRYSKRMDITVDRANRLNPGDPLPIPVDQRHPSRVMIL